jgi:hypothetical protein
MTNSQERRADGIQRVPVEAMVEVCGVGGKQTPFEAESADVSGRGIRLRTAYLPDTGAPVVCRFENAGREVIAEGVVAWCQKETRGGEFGVRFTALDARSADTLRELCGLENPVPPSAKQADVPQPAHAKVIPGAKVKLHIEGLGSPMRARVDEGKGGHLSVGSSLEFLRLGRKLEVESIEDGSRHEARIDGLDVMIDPSTGVPRLLVLLKTADDENTPQPSVVDASRRTASSSNGASVAKDAKSKDTASRRDPASEPQKEKAFSPDSDDPTEEQIDAMVGRARRIAGATRRKMTEVSIQLGTRLGPGLGRVLQGVRQFSRRPTEPPRRRTTSAPAQSTSNADRKLRPQNRASTPDVAPSSIATRALTPKMRRVAGGVVATGLLATVIVVAMQRPDSAKGAAAAGAVENRTSQSVGSLALAQSPTPGAPALAVAGQSVPGAHANPGTALTVPVPLFGNTSMAAMERPPLTPAPEESPEAIAAREQAIAKATQAAVAAGHDSAKMSEDPSATTAESSEEPATKPEDVAPFGHGRMKDPILYRLKLDLPGEALKGTTSSKGFSVTIPGRKLLESPSGFVKRDPRFAKITSQQSSDGVKITWQFKDEAPPFRVRLRKTAVEILISESAKPTK